MNAKKKFFIFFVTFFVLGNVFVKISEAAESVSALEENISKYSRIIETDPSNEETYLKRAEAYLAVYTEQHNSAESKTKTENEFKQIMSPYSDYRDKALSDYNKVLSLNPNNAQAYCGRAKVHIPVDIMDFIFRKDAGTTIKDVLDDCNKAISLKPNYADAYYWRSKAYQLMSTQISLSIRSGTKFNSAEERSEALKTFVEVIDRALDDLNQAISLNSNAWEYYYERASLHKITRKNDRAIADYTSAISLNRENEMLYSERGDLYKKLKRYDLAIADYTKTIELCQVAGKSFVTYYLDRAEAYEKNKNYSKALDDYNKVLETRPNSETAKSGIKRMQKKIK